MFSALPSEYYSGERSSRLVQRRPPRSPRGELPGSCRRLKPKHAYSTAFLIQHVDAVFLPNRWPPGHFPPIAPGVHRSSARRRTPLPFTLCRRSVRLQFSGHRFEPARSTQSPDAEDDMSTKPQHITIVGAGLVGALFATYMVRRGYQVTVYERRPDMRKAKIAAGRSINLVATARGLNPLDRVDLRQAVLDLTVEVRGRTMHDQSGQLTYHPYGKDAGEVNHSVPRGGLNRLLIERAEQAGAKFVFSHRLVDSDFSRGSLTFQDEAHHETVQVMSEGPIIGADGSGSAIRAELDKQPGHESRYEALGHSYKELEIPATESGDYRIDANSLHIWPRGHHMMMALANQGGSFTVTLYLPDEGELSFTSLDSPQKVQDYFGDAFPDSLPLLPNLTEEFFENSTGRLGTVRARPWTLSDKVALIGDAAHAIVPFFGQGMNSGFEDCAVLDNLLDSHQDDWSAALAAYGEVRKKDGDAIADMALENFVEMRDHVGDPAFLMRKGVDHRLEQAWPDEYRTRYSMVVYSSIPYHHVQSAGRIQSEILDRLCRGIGSPDDIDMDLAHQLVREKLTPFFAQHGIQLSY